MKKNQKRDQEHEKKNRRLTLSRETIQRLNEPALLRVVGGVQISSNSAGSTTDPVGCPGI